MISISVWNEDKIQFTTSTYNSRDKIYLLVNLTKNSLSYRDNGSDVYVDANNFNCIEDLIGQTLNGFREVPYDRYNSLVPDNNKLFMFDMMLDKSAELSDDAELPVIDTKEVLESLYNNMNSFSPGM